MKKRILGAILVFYTTNVLAISIPNMQTFTGDKRLACEAILCLASPVLPAECSSAIAKYFSIHFKKPWKTLEARKSFLNLCPLGSSEAILSDDKDLEDWRNSLVNLTGTCYVPDLNKRYQRTILSTETIRKCSGHGEGCTTITINHYGYRINPTLDNNCKILSSHKYSNYNLKYVCSTKFYPEEDWNNGYEKKEITQEQYNSLKDEDKFKADKLTKITYTEYKNLPENKRKIDTSDRIIKYYRIDLGFYQKIYINKNCWINENKK
ncbi:hypothetical protein JG677_07560 [Campylobacter sp. TTU-622]|uniref:TrbM/KikA/MpfK family conjugal transfer protein n=1 Tax=Campylobacter sp. TTU-622 TaxID=2800583 RepID=UPI0017A7F67D|nr:TrbM/KikA/MpfK family conjugal transfer protein [Campylobacter sp. TTU-622]EAI8568761.1 hypothetical protein [Campylobacter jejuni]EFS0701727.1 hypothetical protein [Campylobacter jejuni]EHS1057422.1 hypothetical protein [Campylobacter jejuni]EHS1059172.1 hypothetical protein [Campylobacter jejuni]EHS1060944.1 hypothetical protein [Campylobacter jejuni]